MRALVLAALFFWSLAILGGLCVACAQQALAEPIRITGRDTLTFDWAAASGGPPLAYEAKLVYLDGTESVSRVGLPPVELRPRYGIPFALSVRGCRMGPANEIVCDGPWGQPTAYVRLCPLPADIDCEVRDGRLAVDSRDFIILSNDWGDSVDEAPDDE